MGEQLAGMDPFTSCSDAAEFEKMIHAQLASQAYHESVRVRRNQPHVATMDPHTASQTLHAAGALKNYKPDRVMANADLSTLSVAQLQMLLKQQQSLATNVSLLRGLPDKGAKVHAHVIAIEQQLTRRRAAQEQLAEVEELMQRVHMQDDGESGASDGGKAGGGGESGPAGGQMDVGAASETAPPSPGGASVASDSSFTSAASSSASSSVQRQLPAVPGGPGPKAIVHPRRHIASSFGAAVAASSSSAAAAAASSGAAAAAPSRVQPLPLSSSGFSQWGRGGEQLARATDASAVNARLMRERGGNIEGKFRRAPPVAISAQEANKLLREQAEHWHASVLESQIAAAAAAAASGSVSFVGGAGVSALRNANGVEEDDDEPDDDLDDEDFDDLDDGLDSVASAGGSQRGGGGGGGGGGAGDRNGGVGGGEVLEEED
jgi:hypothetical protein